MKMRMMANGKECLSLFDDHSLDPKKTEAATQINSSFAAYGSFVFHTSAATRDIDAPATSRTDTLHLMQ